MVTAGFPPSSALAGGVEFGLQTGDPAAEHAYLAASALAVACGCAHIFQAARIKTRCELRGPWLGFVFPEERDEVFDADPGADGGGEGERCLW